MKKKRKAWIWIVVLVLILGLGGGAVYYFYFRTAGDAGTAYVQSVAAILGLGGVGQNAVYSGIVEAKEVIGIDPQSDMRIAECYVESGSKVKTGDPLFRYDVDDLTLQHAQLLLDITGLENELRTEREELESLNKRLERAKENAQYEIKLNIQTIDLEIRKKEYDLKDKQEQAESLQELIDASVIFSPVDGIVRSVKDASGESNPFGYGESGDTSYITIVAGTDYCVKGTVSEQTVYTLYEGMPVLVRSRVDDSVYPGTIYKINTDSAQSDQSRVYYDGGMGDQASKYAFYVELESIEGLLVGQHVLIDLNTAETDENAMLLPAAYLMQENGRFYVWAANAENRIEKREVQVGAFDEASESYPIEGGLKPKDRIAFPDDTVHAGMLASETMYTDPDAAPDGNTFAGEEPVPGNIDLMPEQFEIPMGDLPADDFPADGIFTDELPEDGVPMDDAPVEPDADDAVTGG